MIFHSYTTPTVLLDQILPDYNFHEVHSVAVNATGARVFAALRAITPGELPVLRVLMKIRSFAALVFGRRPALGGGSGSLLEQVMRAGFVVLGEDPGRELVLGVIAQPRRLLGDVRSRRVRSLDEFLAFREPSFAKMAINFWFEEGCLTTETRIWLPDRATLRRFAAYWVLIRTGSGLIRREWLRRIRERAALRHQ